MNLAIAGASVSHGHISSLLWKSSVPPTLLLQMSTFLLRNSFVALTVLLHTYQHLYCWSPLSPTVLSQTCLYYRWGSPLFLLVLSKFPMLFHCSVSCVSPTVPSQTFLYWRTLKTHHLLKCYFMSKIEYFHHVKNKIDKFRHLACIQ